MTKERMDKMHRRLFSIAKAWRAARSGWNYLMVWIDIALDFNKEVLSRHLRLHLTVLLVKKHYISQ